MKKQMKKLVLAKETLQHLELRSAHGGTFGIECTGSCGATTCGGPENTCMEMFLSERNC